MTETSAPRSNPYPGPRSFQLGETLYGREREARELLDLLIAERIVLLYSPSGAGKTSLIQAALIPEIEREGFRVLPIMRPGLGASTKQANQAGNPYILSLLLCLEENVGTGEQRPRIDLTALSLDDYLKTRPAGDPTWNGDVLIFDQFEEILSINPADAAAKTEFFEMVGQALRDRNRWALFAMREEFIGGLDPYLRLIPTRFANTFRLDRLGPEEAQQAMQQPASAAGVDFTDAGALKLVDDLRTIRVQQADGSTALALGNFVEPVQLQVVCRKLWDKLPPDDIVIDLVDVQEMGDVDSALRGYYADSVTAVAAQAGIRERVIRDWVDSQLITEQGIRGQVLQGAGESQGLDNRAIWLLVDTHLVRAEQRRGATWFELAHDRLVNPVRTDNAAWRKTHLSELQRRAALWDQEERPKGLLLQGEALIEAEQWARSHQDELESYEQEFLATCQETSAAAQRERRQARYIRWLATGATMFSIVAFALAVLATTQTGTIKKEKRSADEAKSTAVSRLYVAETAEAKAQHAEATANAERDRAEEQTRIALSRQAAAVASDTLNRGNGPLALLLSTRAYEVADTVEAENVMHEALAAWRGRGIMGSHAQRAWGLSISPDSKIAVTSAEEEIKLWELDGERRTMTLPGHTAPVTDLKISPDGRYVASVSRDGTGRLWETETGSQVWQVPVPNEGISTAFHPDGQTVAFGGDDGKITLWQIEPLSKTATLEHGSYGYPLQIAYSPDGQLLLAAYTDNVARIWRGNQVTMLEGHNGIVRDAAFSPDGRLVATISDDDTIRLWDAQTGQQLDISTSAKDLEPWLKFSPDGKFLAASSRANVAYLWEMAGNQISDPPSILAGHSEPVSRVAFSPNGRYLGTASFDTTARLWDLQTRTSVAVLAGHTDHVENLSFSPDGQYLMTVGRDRTVRLWDPNLDRGGENALRSYSAPVRLAGLAVGGQRIVTVQQGQAHVWTPSTDEERAFDVDAAVVRAVALSPDGTLLAVSDDAGQTSLWDVASGRRAANQPAQSQATVVYGLAFDSTGQHLAMTRQDGTVALWNTATSSPEATLAADQKDVYAIGFDRDGTYLAAGNGNGTVRLWNWQQATVERTLQAGSLPIWAVAFAADGQHLAAASHDGKIRIWDLSVPTDAAVAVLPGDSSVRTLAFSPDSSTLAAGDEQGVATLWKWRTAEPIVLKGHRRWLTDVAFFPDGQQLVTAGQDGTVRIWPASIEATLDLACSRLQTELPSIPSEPGVPGSSGVTVCQGLQATSWAESDRLPAPLPPIPMGSLLPKPSRPVIYYFEAVPGTTIVKGEQVRLRWDAENAQRVYLYIEDEECGVEECGVIAPFEKPFLPQQNTTYRLVAKNDLGTSERKLTVTVVHNP